MARTRRIVVVGVAVWLAIGAGVAAIVAARVTVATTATLIYTPPPSGGTGLIRNAGTASVYLGDAAVTTATGWELIPGAAVSLPAIDPIYGIVAASTNRVDVVETSRR